MNIVIKNTKSAIWQLIIYVLAIHGVIMIPGIFIVVPLFSIKILVDGMPPPDKFIQDTVRVPSPDGAYIVASREHIWSAGGFGSSAEEFIEISPTSSPGNWIKLINFDSHDLPNDGVRLIWSGNRSVVVFFSNEVTGIKKVGTLDGIDIKIEHSPSIAPLTRKSNPEPIATPTK